MTRPDELLRAPWELSPEPPGSLQWKMGAGDDYLEKWLRRFLALSDREQLKLLSDVNVPPEWREMLTRFLEREREFQP